MQPFISAPAYARYGVGRAKPALYASPEYAQRALRRARRWLDKTPKRGGPPRHIRFNSLVARA